MPPRVHVQTFGRRRRRRPLWLAPAALLAFGLALTLYLIWRAGVG